MASANTLTFHSLWTLQQVLVLAGEILIFREVEYAVHGRGSLSPRCFKLPEELERTKGLRCWHPSHSPTSFRPGRNAGCMAHWLDWHASYTTEAASVRVSASSSQRHSTTFSQYLLPPVHVHRQTESKGGERWWQACELSRRPSGPMRARALRASLRERGSLSLRKPHHTAMSLQCCSTRGWGPGFGTIMSAYFVPATPILLLFSLWQITLCTSSWAELAGVAPAPGKQPPALREKDPCE